MMIAPFAKLAPGKHSLTFSERLHQVGCHRAFWSDVDCEQCRRLGGTRIARDPMNRARRFPPRPSRLEGLLWPVANLRGDRSGNDECHDAVGVEVGGGARSRWIRHFNEGQFARGLAGQFLFDYIAPR